MPGHDTHAYGLRGREAGFLERQRAQPGSKRVLLKTRRFPSRPVAPFLDRPLDALMRLLKVRLISEHARGMQWHRRWLQFQLRWAMSWRG